MIRKISFIVIAVLIGLGSFIMFNAKYIRIGTIVEIRNDAIVIQSNNADELPYVLPFDKKSRFYNAVGIDTAVSALKVGDRVKVKLFPRSYGGIIRVRKYKTVRWIKVLPKR